MSGSPLTPLSKRYPASPDRPRNTPHPKACPGSPARLTPRTPNLYFVSTDTAFSPLRTETSDASDRETQGVECLEITSIKVDAVFETAVLYLDTAYLNPAQPQNRLLSQAQNLLHQVLISLEGENNWQLRAFCEIEMARASSGSYFQQHWIEKGLNDLDIYLQKTITHENNFDLVEEIICCQATYLNVSKMWQESLPALSARALSKHHECESYLQQLNISVEVLSPSQASSPAQDNSSIEPSDGSSQKNQEVEFISIEKADEIFETAVLYLDAAYLNPAQPKYRLISRAQNLLHQVLIFSKNNWRLRAFCKIEMARVSHGSYFQQYWIEKGLNDLDIYFQTTCLIIKHNNLDLVEEVINCSATYLNISNMCKENLPALSKRALKRHYECEIYLLRPNSSVEESSIPQAASPAKDISSTVNKTKAVFLISMSLFILGLAIARHDRLKHMISEIFTTTMIYYVRPGWVILSQSFPKTEFLKLLV